MEPEEAAPLGIVLVNLGTPDEPTPSAIRRYLAEFLSDPRVVNIPRLIWLPILYGFILPFRPGKIVNQYRAIWRETGSPIRSLTAELATNVESALAKQFSRTVFVKSAMTYGNPSIEDALAEIRDLGAKEVLTIPLYPQYSTSTTAAVFDKVSNVLSRTRVLPALRFISGYFDNPTYINSITASIRPFVAGLSGDSRLLMSFHGLPRAQVEAGDPYLEQCRITAELVASNLGLQSDQWQITFQSQFGPAEWLKPYTSEVLSALPAQGIKHVVIVCPGFSIDCLETLEEIEIRYKKVFLDSGGETYRYIPALNAGETHIDVMIDLVSMFQC